MHERNFYNDLLRRFENAKIMGVLNITPDSFSDGGINYDFSDAVNSAREMVNYNVDILDVGGESTRPGARPVPIEEELRRVIPLINILAKKFPQAEISVDTYKSEVARQALISGAKLVNDISGGTFSPDMFDTVARYNAKIVIMHIKGTPRTMQKNPEYDDVVAEITKFLGKQAERAISAGIPRENIIIDPGIGFGKRYEH
ncbi:dihydropteroate synthase, partial [bacterium]